jgi:peptidoglycan hydrolase-like protein with peptidoglycan-binding domain
VLSTTRTTATLGVLALLLVGCNEGSPATVAGPTPEPTVTSAAPSLPPVVVPTVTPTTAPPSPTASPKPKPPPYDVKAVQTQLTALHYYAGPIDGVRDSALRSAVMAFQKVNGLGRDGSVGPKTLAALKDPVTPKLKGKGKGVRVEVDLTRQVLYVVKDDVITRILSVSSGSGKKYRTKSGYLATALSPVGYYTIQRRILGERKADLGVLYDPQYFYKGWAIHGSNSVPGYPASHGCTRVSRADAKFLLTAIGVGTPVYVYGGTFTFPAGSSAPGTDDPGGDTAEPTATPTPTPSPSARPTPSATPSPTPTTVPTILPSP